MNMMITVVLRVLLYLSLAFMVFDFVRVEQQFDLMARGYTNGFTTTIIDWPGWVFIAVTGLLVVLNIVQVVMTARNRHAHTKEYILPEYDVRDERAVANTGKAVRIAFVTVLVVSFFVIGSYMIIPTYYLDYVWYPMFSTAAIPVAGLLSYLVSYQVLHSR
ncbi:hypothetical protein [Sporosarcina koreensis]|uniref:hypothetical protein n=1 Tax=Sporosarcina koreensis TaxID=334735 RepID=UPI00058BC662|nr:hypothetical protein [Sporosarcina koreensis]